MSRSKRLSVSEQLLLAAYDLEEKLHGGSFTAEDLVVSAWSMFPATFGLKGHLNEDGTPLYPDSNRVFAEIMGTKPLRKRGLLSKTGPKQYALTESGRRAAQKLRILHPSGAQNAVESRSGLPRDFDRLLHRLVASRATSKVRDGNAAELSFFDACMFWGITPRSSSIKLRERLENTRQVVAAARDIVGKGTVRTSSGTITHEDIKLLQEVDKILRDRFHAELEIIAQRRGDR